MFCDSHLSCNAADLNGATHLAEGDFYDPVTYALKEIGLVMAGMAPYIDPFESIDVTSYGNIALSFPGNQALTSSAGALDGGHPGRLFEKDEIFGGKLPSFSGVHHSGSRSTLD